MILNLNKRYKAQRASASAASSDDAELRVFPLEGLPEIEAGDDLGALLAAAAERQAG